MSDQIGHVWNIDLPGGLEYHFRSSQCSFLRSMSLPRGFRNIGWYIPEVHPLLFMANPMQILHFDCGKGRQAIIPSFITDHAAPKICWVCSNILAFSWFVAWLLTYEGNITDQMWCSSYSASWKHYRLLTQRKITIDAFSLFRQTIQSLGDVYPFPTEE